jgi:hypothetical protein
MLKSFNAQYFGIVPQYDDGTELEGFGLPYGFIMGRRDGMNYTMVIPSNALGDNFNFTLLNLISIPTIQIGEHETFRVVAMYSGKMQHFFADGIVVTWTSTTNNLAEYCNTIYNYYSIMAAKK